MDPKKNDDMRELMRQCLQPLEDTEYQGVFCIISRDNSEVEIGSVFVAGHGEDAATVPRVLAALAMARKAIDATGVDMNSRGDSRGRITDEDSYMAPQWV